MADSAEAYSIRSSPLLTMSTELIEMVLTKYFENASLTASHHPQDPRIIGVPSLSIEQTCKQLRALSLATRTKHVPRKLVAESNRFLTDTVPIFCLQTNFTWVRNHVTSLHVILRPHVTGRSRVPYNIIHWKDVMIGFPNLKDLELRIVRYTKKSARTVMSYVPLDTEEQQRRLARNVVEHDWDSKCTITVLKIELFVVEDAYYAVRGRRSPWYRLLTSPENKLNVRVDLSIVAVDSRGHHFYCSTTTYKSEGPFDGSRPDRDFGMTVLSKKCQVGMVEESVEMEMEKTTEEELENLPVWDNLENLAKV